MMQCSPFPSKNIARKFAKKKTDALLTEQVENYRPDIVFIYSMKNLDVRTVEAIRRAAPKTLIAGRDEDPFPERNAQRLAIARQCDFVVNTSAGRFLKTYKDSGVPCCAFIPDMCDVDIQHPYETEEKWRADIIFTGKAEHTRLERENERYELVRRLRETPGVKIYGSFGIPRVEGLDYFRAISSARIGFNINAANDVRLYHSDRLMNYVSCGTFTLARRVPDTELLFKDGVHLKYFDGAEEFFELSKWYLEHEQERKKIASAGMERAHREFNCTKIAGCMIDLVDKGDYYAPWKTIL